MTTLDRRSFLLSVGAALLAASCGDPLAGALPRDRVLGLFDAKRLAPLQKLGAVARSTLELGSSEAAVEALWSHAALSGSPSRDELRTALNSRIDTDFQTDTTVTVDGWLLSRAEALVLAACAA